MSMFDTAFDQAVEKAAPGATAARPERSVSHAHMEATFHTVDRFDYDPTRLVVAASVVGEQYRTLKTNLSRFNQSEGISTFTFSSSVKGEGKTTAAVNCARAFGREPGAKVAVVDCDFRRPGVGDFCRIEPRAGFEDVITGAAGISDCGIYSRRDNFTVFPVARRPEETTDILSSPGFDEALAELESVFEIVLFDTSPVLLTTEPLVLGAKTGGLVLVVRANSTQRESVLFAQGQLEQAGCRLLGLVLNARPSYVPRFWLLRKFDYFQDDYRYHYKAK